MRQTDSDAHGRILVDRVFKTHPDHDERGASGEDDTSDLQGAKFVYQSVQAFSMYLSDWGLKITNNVLPERGERLAEASSPDFVTSA